MSQPVPRGPHKRFSFGPNGPTVSVWHKVRDTANGGPRIVRTLTISAGRYIDETGKWQDAPIRPENIPAIVFLLQEAQRYLFETPVPSAEADEPAESPAP